MPPYASRYRHSHWLHSRRHRVSINIPPHEDDQNMWPNATVSNHYIWIALCSWYRISLFWHHDTPKIASPYQGHHFDMSVKNSLQFHRRTLLAPGNFQYLAMSFWHFIYSFGEGFGSKFKPTLWHIDTNNNLTESSLETVIHKTIQITRCSTITSIFHTRKFWDYFYIFICT